MKPDMDGFLIDGMRLLNALPSDRVHALENEFKDAMTSASAIFGNDAFRKRYRVGEVRFPINKALFEVTFRQPGTRTSAERALLVERNGVVREGMLALCNDRLFETAISQGTGDIRKVGLRFSSVASLFERVLTDDHLAASR